MSAPVMGSGGLGRSPTCLEAFRTAESVEGVGPCQDGGRNWDDGCDQEDDCSIIRCSVEIFGQEKETPPSFLVFSLYVKGDLLSSPAFRRREDVKPALSVITHDPDSIE